ncbi:MAG TPA: hypothetical protein PLG75_01195 [Methanoculleus sp.]|nr:hypothetical protein [Methanoculleus sp.]
MNAFLMAAGMIAFAGIAGVMVFWVQMPEKPGAIAVTATRSGRQTGTSR